MKQITLVFQLLANCILVLWVASASAQQPTPASSEKKVGKPDDYFFITSLFKKIDGVSYAYPYNREKSEWNAFAGNFVVVYSKPSTPTNPLIDVYLNKFSNSFKRADINLVPSLDLQLASAQVILKDVEPTGRQFSVEKGSFVQTQQSKGNIVEILARPESLAYVQGSSLTPAAGFRGVRTYLQVKGKADNPLWIGRNFKVWNGEVYLDGEGKLYLKEGASFHLVEESSNK